MHGVILFSAVSAISTGNMAKSDIQEVGKGDKQQRGQKIELMWPKVNKAGLSS